MEISNKLYNAIIKDDEAIIRLINVTNKEVNQRTFCCLYEALKQVHDICIKHKTDIEARGEKVSDVEFNDTFDAICSLIARHKFKR